MSTEKELQARDNLIAKEFEAWAKKVGLSSVQYDELMILVTKGLKYIARDIADSTMNWSVEDFIKQQVELQKDRDNKTGVFKD